MSNSPRTCHNSKSRQNHHVFYNVYQFIPIYFLQLQYPNCYLVSSTVAVESSTIFGYFTFFLFSFSWAHRMSFNRVEIFGAVFSWCSIFKIAAFTSLATCQRKNQLFIFPEFFYFALYSSE